MTKGQLILSCLKLMYDIDDTSISANDISTGYEDLKSRIVNIPDSIDRAIDEIVRSNKLPKYTKELDPFWANDDYTTLNEINTEEQEYITNYIRVGNALFKYNQETNKYEKQPNLYYIKYTIPNDVYKINNIDYIIDNGLDYFKESNVSVRYENENTISFKRRNQGKYILNYSPNYTESINLLSDNDNITIDGTHNIPDNILRIIPYYVKGDCYEEDGAKESILALNKFNSLLDKLETTKNFNYQSAVKKSFTW